MRRQPESLWEHAIVDVVEGVVLYRVWWNYAVYDTIAKYRRTFLGPFWNSLTVILIVAILSVLWSQIFGVPVLEFLPRISIGYVTWWLISNIVTGATGVFASLHRALLLNTTIPKTAMLLRHIASSFLLFLHHLVPVVIVFVVLQIPTLPTLHIAVLGVAAILIAGIPVSFIIGVACVRYRDVQVLINTIMGIVT
jgi:homopolymeric O-antigen transport system permease protein